MHLLTFTLYGFGQFLQILLWVFLPVFVLSLLVTTYLQYRKKTKLAGQLQQALPAGHNQPSSAGAGSSHEAPVILYTESGTPPQPSSISQSPDITGHVSPGTTTPHAENQDSPENQQTPEDQDGPEDYRGNPYKGLLWMKNKYEQERDLADTRYEQLKTDFRRSEERMAIMLAEQAVLRDLLEKKDLRILFLQGQLDDRQSWINGQNERSQQDKTRYEELVAKLEFSSQLLLKIHKELDISKGLNMPSQQLNNPSHELNASSRGLGTSSEAASAFSPEPSTSSHDPGVSAPGPNASPEISSPAKDIPTNNERAEEARPFGETKIISWTESDDSA